MANMLNILSITCTIGDISEYVTSIPTSHAMSLACPPKEYIAEVMLMSARNNNLDRATNIEQTSLET